MESFEQQKQFFEAAWPGMQSRAENGGGAAVVEFINGHSDDLERRVLYSFARQGLVHKDWQGRNFDDYITVAEAGIAECLRQAAAEEDAETKKKRTNAANVISYNLGADLAFCWGDGKERRTEHYLRGLKAGEDCLRWRRQLGNPFYTHNMAHWLRGVHRLALGQSAAALSDFGDCLQFAELAAEADGKEIATDDSVLLSRGWLALTKLALGDTAARESFDEIKAIFRSRSESEDAEEREDAQWYLKQLENAEGLLLN